VARDIIPALTSLSPTETRVGWVQSCIRSWRAAGLDVFSFNHATEIPRLQQYYDVEFVPLSVTSAHVFGTHCAPISELLSWAARRDGPAILINSDIKLALAPWEVDRVRRLCADGLCYFVRHNQETDGADARPELHGIDAFLFDGRHVPHMPTSFLSMGQPFWDYWLPHAFMASGLPTYSVGFPAAYHLIHRTNWSWETWHRCALEFARATGDAANLESFEACLAMSRSVRASLEARSTSVSPQPSLIEAWLRATFGSTGPKTFLELGSHCGADTAWLSELPEVTLHAFEPDPRNEQPARANVTLHRAAVGARDGRGKLILSREGWGQPWTYSSSTRRPANHLERYPVSFDGEVDVQLITLDTFFREQGLERVDFIWADVQGAEGDVIRGGEQALRRTRFLYTEYSDDELYEGQPTLSEILALLPAFRVLELWPDDVLLENRSFVS
jgi:FkbM family methyltransferase